MIKTLLLLLLTVGVSSTVRADTIDFWHIYYNNSIIHKFNQYERGQVVLKIEDVKTTDSLTIKYFYDTPCYDCKTQVAVKSGAGYVITTGQGIGTFNPIKIAVFDLLIYHLNANKENYEVFYQEEQRSGRRPSVLIFSIKFE